MMWRCEGINTANQIETHQQIRFSRIGGVREFRPERLVRARVKCSVAAIAGVWREIIVVYRCSENDAALRVGMLILLS
jgi:hypothetical protein